MKYIMFLLLMAIACSTTAATITIGGSTDCASIAGNFDDSTKAAMTAACVEATKNTIAAPSSVQEATQWGLMAKEFAMALGIAAREIGVSVNEFVASPAGHITVAVILWKTLGASLAKIFIVVWVWGVGFWVLRHIWTHSYETRESVNIFGATRTKRERVYYNWDNGEDTQVICAAVVCLAMAGLTAACIAS